MAATFVAVTDTRRRYFDDLLSRAMSGRLHSHIIFIEFTSKTVDLCVQWPCIVRVHDILNGPRGIFENSLENLSRTSQGRRKDVTVKSQEVLL